VVTKATAVLAAAKAKAKVAALAVPVVTAVVPNYLLKRSNSTNASCTLTVLPVW
jgi:hypothetical protein